MAEIVSIQGVTHNPLFWRTLPTAEPGSELAAIRDRFDVFADRLEAADPDVVLVVGTDHLTQLSTDNMPAFLVGKQRSFSAIFWNETREFGIPQRSYEGHVGLAEACIEGALDRHIDVAYSNELRLDHACVVPLEYLLRGSGVPVVPILTNCICPPLPRAARFYEVGARLREAIESTPHVGRVAIVLSGHLSVEIGGPRQFRGAPSPGFDAEVTDLIAAGKTAELLELCTFDNLRRAGNVTHQFLNFLIGLGMTGGGPATTAVQLPSRFTATPFYEWEV